MNPSNSDTATMVFDLQGTSRFEVDRKKLLEAHIRDIYGSGVSSEEDEGTISGGPKNGKLSVAPNNLTQEDFPDIPERIGIDELPSRQVFLTSKKWEGYVVSKGRDSFFARLRDLSSPENVEEEAELPISDVSPDDMPLLGEGAPFIFSVGYRITNYGSRERCSRIRFRRLPKWSADEILDGYEKAKAIVNRFKIE
jgi:hypothetical protein